MDNNKTKTLVKDFPPIINDIMIVGTSATAQSRKRGMYYTSDGGNDIWKILDACIYEATNYNPGFHNFITNEYKKIKLTENDIKIIADYLDQGLFLADVTNPLNSTLSLLKQKQIYLISLLNKYHIGFCDIVSQCDMKSSADTDIENEIIKSKETLQNLLKDKKAIILNGSGQTVERFKEAFDINNTDYASYNLLKKQLHVFECLSSSGANRKYEKERLEQWKAIIVPIEKI